MREMSHVQSVSKWLSLITGACMILLPISLFAIFAGGGLDSLIRMFSYSKVVAETLVPWQYWAGAVSSAIPLIAYLILLNDVRRLFSFYAKGEVLSYRCARLIHKIGVVFFLIAVLGFILVPLQSLILAYDTVNQSGTVSVALNSNTVFNALLGGVFMVIGWVMAEATRIAEDHKGIV